MACACVACVCVLHPLPIIHIQHKIDHWQHPKPASQLVTSCVDGARRRLPVSCSYSGQYVALSKSNSLELDDIQSRASVENVCSIPPRGVQPPRRAPKTVRPRPGFNSRTGRLLFSFLLQASLAACGQVAPFLHVTVTLHVLFHSLSAAACQTAGRTASVRRFLDKHKSERDARRIRVLSCFHPPLAT